MRPPLGDAPTGSRFRVTFFSDDDRALGHQFVDRGDRLVITIGHDDALAGGEAVELHHHRLAECAPPLERFVGRGGEVERG